MKNQKGSATVWMIVILVIVIVVGAAYWYWTQNSNQPTSVATTELPTQQNSVSGNQTVANNVQTSSTAPNPVSVSGMSEYTDSSFGFSFWYPSSWTVQIATTKNAFLEEQTGNSFYYGDTLVKSLIVSNGTDSILLDEYASPSGLGMYSKAYNNLSFDSKKDEWVESNSGSGAVPVDISSNTMGGLHIIFKSVVPLSSQNFVVSGNGSDTLTIALLKTIVATDPSVATPASPAQQTAIIQAEQSAYTGQQ